MSFFERAAMRHLVYPPSPRFVPTRLILINYWLYQRQVFYFAAGKLFLTGDNGSGKSTALTAAVTSIFDGDTSPSRMDPFGGGKRSLRYYLLGDREAGFEYDSRRAYVALEFQHPDGGFMTVGLGLQASSGSRDLQKWGFSVPDRVEFDDGISLVSSGNEPLSRRQLRDSLDRFDGRVVESVEEYAKLVRKTLYPQASDDEYGKLLELLLTIRGAKLGREVRPTEIEKLLRLSLPRLDQGILEQLREGIEGMDRHQRRLEVLEAQLSAASKISSAFFDAALARLAFVKAQNRLAEKTVQRLEQEVDQTRERLEVLRGKLEQQTAAELEQTQEQTALELERDSLEAQLQNADGALRDAENKLEETRRDVKREQERLRSAKERLETGEVQQQNLSAEHVILLDRVTELETGLQGLEWYENAESLKERQSALNTAGTAWARFDSDTERLSEREFASRKATEQVLQAREQLATDTEQLETVMQQTALELAEQAAALFGTPQPEYQLALETTLEPSDVLGLLEPSAIEMNTQKREAHDLSRSETREIGAKLNTSKAELLALENASEAVPSLPTDRARASELLTAAGISHGALYRCLKPKTANIDGLEAALLHSGILTALVVPDEQITAAINALKTAKLEDVLLKNSSEGAGLNGWLDAEDNAPSSVKSWLETKSNSVFASDGTWQNGLLLGVAQPSKARFIGVAAREAERGRQLEILRERVSELERQLEKVLEVEQEAYLDLNAFERAWQGLRDARMERKQRFAAQQQRDTSASRFDDRTREQVTALDALSAAQKAASAATQALETVLLPLNLEMTRNAFTAAQGQLSAAQATQAALENHQERSGRLQAETLRLEQTLEERRLEIVELDQKRLELELRRDQLTERVSEMRAQLENPDIKAWRERLNKVRNRLSELRTALRELARSLASTQGEFEVAQKRLPEINIQLENAKNRLDHTKQLFENALALHPRAAAAPGEEIHESLETLEQSAQRLENALDKLFYAEKAALETPETFLPVLDLHQPRFTLEGLSVSSDELTTHLAAELEEAQRLLTEEEARVFHNELVSALAEKLDERLREARGFIKDIRKTLSELKFHDEQLDLELERKVTGGLADLIDGKVAPNFQPPAWLEQVGATVRELVARLRHQANPDISFPQALEAALDYREWYGFTFYSIVADRRVEITDRKFQSRSGGERSAVLYTFMFAALGARFAAMGFQAPRLIGLDEAFAGMDPHNIAALYQIMNSLDLSLIATSPSDIYLSRSLDIASAYRLFRVSSLNGDGVSSIARLWNGSRAIDMGM